MNEPWGKLYERTFTGSMCGAGPVVFAVWCYVIAHARPPKGVVSLNPLLIAASLGGCSVDEVVSAIDLLCAPDDRSRTDTLDGRRIVKTGSYSYECVNFSTYREGRQPEERKEQVRSAVARHRAKASKDVIPDVSHCNPLKAQAEAEAEAYKTLAPSVLVDTASRNPPPEQAETGKPSKAYRAPACPNQEIIDMFHATLPTLPHVEVLNDARKRAITARWKEVCAESKLTREAGLEWFAWFFGRVSESGWLMGRVKGLRGDVFTQCTIDFLMAPTKFTKVIEGFYHRDQRQA